jgi:hypothetical protein
MQFAQGTQEAGTSVTLDSAFVALPDHALRTGVD